jgi:hypothetical protein
VGVIVDEARRHEPSARIDYAGPRRSVRVGLRVRPDGQQPLAADGERLGEPAGRISRPDARVSNDQIRLLRLESRDRRDEAEEDGDGES